MRAIPIRLDGGLFVLRLALGAPLVYHGLDKLIPFHQISRTGPFAGANDFAEFVAHLGLPYWLAYLSIFTELVGGLCVVLGMLTRLVVIPIAINMLVALLTVNVHHGVYSSEYPLALFAMAVTLFLTGGGSYSLDRGALRGRPETFGSRASSPRS